jgi:hypothetical protein
MYNGHIEAYHLEGQTRGRTPEEKAKHPEWTESERLGLDAFFDKWVGVNWRLFSMETR